MRSLTDTKSRWEETFRAGSGIADLQRAVKFNGPNSPCAAGLRSVCWKAFLLWRNAPSEMWPELAREARASYSTLCDQHLRFIRHPEQLTALTIDPLADDPDSPWDTVRKDETVRAEILQDVSRLPDEPFYHEAPVQTMILDILFMYCKLNPSVGGYRQGMHELLAPIVWVVAQDAVDRATAITPDDPAEALMAEMLDPAFVEHDAFALFSKVMESATRLAVLEADYSVALQSMLKYPAPPPPHGPHTFVDDAMYLRDHFDAAGGVTLIFKYTGKSPANTSVTSPTPSRVPTPSFQKFNSLRQRTLGARAPLSTSARILQQPGGVEALLQGAAKNMIERGEKLGINQAVRDAMGEFRRNVQGLQETRSTPNGGRSLKHIEAVEIAAAKVQFVKACLEDPTLALPEEELPPINTLAISSPTEASAPTVALDTTPVVMTSSAVDETRTALSTPESAKASIASPKKEPQPMPPAKQPDEMDTDDHDEEDTLPPLKSEITRPPSRPLSLSSASSQVIPDSPPPPTNTTTTAATTQPSTLTGTAKRRLSTLGPPVDGRMSPWDAFSPTRPCIP
ncbi:hypothetical protein CHGG_02860 [Chaetomium globosum CBS 148.51]|uniref:Rab-GAP TBC domain-containing protein n=1 Tax=Chaetomium globosum (strain ATCC 6205 / CBS 148.51 / DSM 1962 / NBRC 6347 / NRRL 1970) TaxID=306901 RepID=Q2HA94_CHAGB|nr:uncharacterized protein CHGG_02860 [Chaetomium globosum CBS 148.51]EAQ90925.1 hypothetical protein CHGG_02860 [Chaetomium globosum CBS 148.51]